MPDLERPEDFEIDGRLGRCKHCSQGGASWTRLSNLRAHEKQVTHKETIQQVLLGATSPTAASVGTVRKHGLRAYVEDVPDDEAFGTAHPAIPWYSVPSSNETFCAAPARPRDNVTSSVDCLPFDLEDIFSGHVDFSSHDNPAPHGALEVTLEDILSGAGLLDTAIAVEDEERPLPTWIGDPWDKHSEDEPGRSDHPAMTAEELSNTHFGLSSATSDVFPYPNRGMMKTDILFSSPLIRFSRTQKEAILAWGRDMDAKNVPSLYALEKFQAAALESVGDPTEKSQATSGNVFYLNSIYHALAQDYSHPEKRQKMRLYPEFSETGVEEVWQASKWLVDAPDAVLTPMTRIRGKDYYINELVLCAEGIWFIPTRFFEFKGALWAKGHRATETEHGLLVDDEQSVQPCTTFLHPWPEIEASTRDERFVFAPASQIYAQAMPNPDRQLAAGLEIECPPIIVFIDDVSGNTSKQWNIHYSAYMSNATLPRADLEKNVNIHFVATSPHASPMEIIRAICDAVKSGSTKPFKVWDAVKKRHVLIRPWILFLPGDNPMQAELCSHIGLNGNYFCRMCHCGGDQKFKASNEGFAALMKPGRARTVTETREAITSQLVMATHAAAEKPLKAAITASGVKDSFATPLLNQLVAKGKILRRSTPARKALSPEMVNKELYDDLMKNAGGPLHNPLLDMDGLDVHLDTPVEPLHTHLLGVVKYFWAQTVWVLEKNGRFADFQARLNSLSRTGLKVPNIMADYMCRYRGSLIGKHFKTISQIMAFAVCGLIDDRLQNAWLSIGHLTVLIWETKITDIKAFTKELREVIQQTMDFAAALSPGLLTEKNKFHILAHLPDHVERFGPPLLFSTERYESFNHIFRLCSIHSNRQAPSRDIAQTFANQERCRHMVSGGYWQDKATGEWVRASPAVRQHIAEHPIDAGLLGVAREKSALPGNMTLPPLPPRVRGRPPPHHPVISWAQTESSRFQPSFPPLAGQWHSAASVVTLNGDSAPVGAEVIIKSDAQHTVSAPRPVDAYNIDASRAEGPTTAGSNAAQPRHPTDTFASIVEILKTTSPSSSASWVIVRDSILMPECHATLKMPLIKRIGALRAVRPQDIHCVVNVQHDCTSGGCTASGTEHVRQEREQSKRTRQVANHTDTTTYIINVASLHNHVHIRNALPPCLINRQPYFEERAQLHQLAAESLRDTRLQKKLAREAQVRKNAEAALRNSVANSAPSDVLGLSAESADPQTGNNGEPPAGYDRDPVAGGGDDPVAGDNADPTAGDNADPGYGNIGDASTSKRAHQPATDPTGCAVLDDAARQSMGIPPYATQGGTSVTQLRLDGSHALPSASSLATPRGPRQKKAPKVKKTTASSCTPSAPSGVIRESQLGEASAPSPHGTAVGCIDTVSDRIASSVDSAPPRKRKRRAQADPGNTAAREALFRSSLL